MVSANRGRLAVRSHLLQKICDGSMITARSSANKLSIAIPTERNGNDINHTKGHNNSARMAIDQQSTKNTSYRKNFSID